MKEYYLYVLYLSNKTYYVGSTTNPSRRIFQHLIGDGSRMTYCQRIKVMELFKLPDISERLEAQFLEKYYAYFLASKLGINKVTYGHKINETNLSKYSNFAQPLVENKKEETVEISKLNNIIDAFYKKKLKEVIIHLQHISTYSA